MAHYSIILCGDFKVDSEGSLIIMAVLQNMGETIDANSRINPPDYSPMLCFTKIYPEYLPGNLEFKGKSHDELEELINRFNLLSNQVWKPITNEKEYASQCRRLLA